MKNIAILLLPEALSSTIAGPVDVLLTAAMIGGLPWRIDIVAETVDAVPCCNGMTLTPSASIDGEKKYDLVIIPSLLVGNASQQQDRGVLIDWLQRQASQGAILASICSGAFLLAATGLLDGKNATTHWALADTFRTLYPKVLLDEQQTIVDNGDTLCCSAGSAWHDLVLHIVQRHLSQAQVLQLSEVFQLLRHNAGQQPFCGMLPPQQHVDAAIQNAIRALTQHLSKQDAMDLAIAASGLNGRTFQRRFKSATGVTANRFLQLARLHEAKQLLIFDTVPVEQIVYQTGYEDASHLRRLFKQHTGLSMRDYRARFARMP